MTQIVTGNGSALQHHSGNLKKYKKLFRLMTLTFKPPTSAHVNAHKNTPSKSFHIFM